MSRWFWFGGLVVTLVLAGVVSNFASSSPDGLEHVTVRGCAVDADGAIVGGDCPAERVRDHELAGSPLADYGLRGVDNDFLATGLSGVIGVLVTLALGAGLFRLLRRRTGPAPEKPAGR